MNFSGYFLLVAAVVTVGFAQQSGAANLRVETIDLIKKLARDNINAKIYPNATVNAQNGYITGINAFVKSEDIILEGIVAAKKVILRHPEGAREIILKAFMNAQIPLLKAGIPTLKSLGRALALSNASAKSGFEDAIDLIAKAALSTVHIIESAEVLFNKGIADAGSAPNQLLEAVRVTVQTGFAGFLKNMQKSFRAAVQALGNAKRNPKQGQIPRPNCKAAAAKDSLKSDVKINREADKALKRGANAKLVQQLREAFLCSLGDFVALVNRSVQSLNKLSKIAAIDPVAGKEAYLRVSDVLEGEINDIASGIYLVIGEISLKTRKQSENSLGAAILAIAVGESEVFTGLKSALEVIVAGLRSEAGPITYDALAKLNSYSRVAFIDAIVKSSNYAFSAL